MNTYLIAEAARKIDGGKLAIAWLEEYGQALVDHASMITLGVQYASGCNGYYEAKDALEAVARKHIATIVAQAKAECRADMAIAEQIIRNEARPSAATPRAATDV